MLLLDALMIAACLLPLVIIGLRFSRRQKTTGSCFVAGHTIPGWAVGLSLLATAITSVTFIAYPGAEYAGDWTLLAPGICFLAVIAGIGLGLIPFFRHLFPARLRHIFAAHLMGLA